MFIDNIKFVVPKQRSETRNAKQLIELARYLVSAVGSKISLNKLSNVFGLSNDTLALYVGYMVDAYLLFEVPHFSYSVKTRHDVTKLPKLYVLDNGLINIVSIKYSKSRGQMFENTALIKLSEQSDEVSYWSELKSEVDFIAGKTAINVTATDEIPEREIKGLNDFRKKHRGVHPLLITESTTKDGRVSLADFLRTGLDAPENHASRTRRNNQVRARGKAAAPAN
ncbi:ATP-binding protein [Candidatus Micrarchaeota archaeon]|nr:ATP-binding protein [Candidatus Micrarchaeota archaeon]